MQQPERRRPVEPPTTRWELPSPRAADRDGIAGVGGDLEPGTLLEAYRRGLFPMPFGRRRLAWFSPDPRAIIPLDGLAVSRSLRRSMRRFDVTRDTSVRPTSCSTAPIPVVPAHGSPRPSWRHTGGCTTSAGRTRSSRSTSRATLVGGLYGVRIGGLFAGEAMFHHARDASKVALVELVDWLTATGATLLDVQWLTPHLASLGAIAVSRDEYLRRLAVAVAEVEER